MPLTKYERTEKKEEKVAISTGTSGCPNLEIVSLLFIPPVWPFDEWKTFFEKAHKS